MSALIEGKPQLPPGMCFVCEMSNPVRYIDTFRDFEGVVRERLDGRKYICEECILDAAKKLGFAEPKVIVELKAQLAQAEETISEVEKEIKALEHLRAAVEHFVNKPKAAPKKPAAKA